MKRGTAIIGCAWTVTILVCGFTVWQMQPWLGWLVALNLIAMAYMVTMAQMTIWYQEKTIAHLEWRLRNGPADKRPSHQGGTHLEGHPLGWPPGNGRGSRQA